jgi:hypothetical protein
MRELAASGWWAGARMRVKEKESRAWCRDLMGTKAAGFYAVTTRSLCRHEVEEDVSKVLVRLVMVVRVQRTKPPRRCLP